jgi:hypothetical protein
VKKESKNNDIDDSNEDEDDHFEFLKTMPF